MRCMWLYRWVYVVCRWGVGRVLVDVCEVWERYRRGIGEV